MGELLARVFSSFREVRFRYLWLSIAMNGYSNTLSLVALSWMALEFTGSPLGVGLVIASRTIPKLVLSLPLGMLSDRMDRRLLIQMTNYAGAATAAAAVVISIAGGVNIYVVLVLAVCVGAFDAAQTTFCKAYVIDLVGRDEAVNGMTMEMLANRVFGIIGGFTSGFLLQSLGGMATFIAMGVAYFLSAAILHAIPRFCLDGSRRHDEEGLVEDSRLPDWQIITGLLRNPIVLIFASIALLAEVFACSSDVLLPSFARDIHQVGEVGLGTLFALSNTGGVIALLVMAAFATRIDSEKMLLVSAAMFGLSLVLFSLAPVFAIAAVVIILVGMAWSLVDVLLPTVLQCGVRDCDRGAVVGIWNLSRGFGPLGQLEIGYLASTVGVAFTQTINGTIFLVSTLFLAFLYYRNRSLARVPGALAS
ncbi:MFS transporter [Elongatibacter sediminis]|uniref:MFS transporter n=1 Tax=Elongatibacter sediminis TaxID=3119006 RepID=A0AAW9RJR9_9GAMM